MKQYVAVTKDKYEFPLYSADSAKELGKKLNLSQQQIFERISRTKKHSKARGQYKLICVDIGDLWSVERGDFIGNNLDKARTGKRSSKACTRR